ncbi:MAG: PQQ-binding-like beta-propeller repeat protein [Thermoleophilia bacterium]|nr:PQQ-binding-like beta-propeller repeat protein [Thermoleophilia bacterium]
MAWTPRLLLVLLVAATSLFVAACGNDDNNDKDADTSANLDFPLIAPAFDAKYLTALPRENWITNGGTVHNDRYSPLDEINDGNVKDLRAEWKVDLQSATEAKYSHENQPIVYNGVAYVSTGENDLFAIDVKTGETKWKYEGNLDQKISTVCCGWLNRGVAIGDGRIYMGRLDGDMVALDQETGKVDWQVTVSKWNEENGGITAAPLYYDGMVYTGVTGGEFGVRGRVTALDAKTGEEKWRFYTTAGPDDTTPCNEGEDCETAGDSWAGDSYKTGGGPVWQTPSVDPELGLIYFTTGNANPDVDGSKRAGSNLYTASFVAVDAKTGKHKWHYQTVHHDIWDYDQPSPTVLFDAEVDGKTVPAIAEAAKSGWMYALNRETGEPIWPVKETPVGQNEEQKTAATQPIPQYDSFSDHIVTDADVKTIADQVKSNPEGKGLKVVKPASDKPEDNVFSPPGKQQVTVVANGPTGGTNWPPSSYNHDTHMLYVCGLDGKAGLYPSGVDEWKAGAVRLGSVLAVRPFGDTPGHLTAINADTGEIEWKYDMSDGQSCYSGSTTTAGNLVFVGQNDGKLVALSADKGEKLWEFQTGAGANSTATVFEQDGEEKILFVAGGNSLAASPHGDNLWLFSMSGTGESLPGIEKGAASGGVDHFDKNGSSSDTGTSSQSGGTDNQSGGTMTADIKHGESVFNGNCSVCHGTSGTGGNGGPDITSVTDVQVAQKQVTNGGGGMPAFGNQLTEQDILDVATYVAQSLGK